MLVFQGVVFLLAAVNHVYSKAFPHENWKSSITRSGNTAFRRPGRVAECGCCDEQKDETRPRQGKRNSQ